MEQRRMKAGVLYAVGDIRCSEVDVPEIAADEVLLRVKYAGVCGTDYERVLKTGTWKFPTILGHEFGGTVVEIGADVQGMSPGDKVVVNPMVPCGTCRYCRDGKFNMCMNYNYLGSRSSGGFAEFAKVKYTNAYRVPQEMADDAIASIDPAAVALHGIVRGGLKPGQSVAVFGAGPIGNYLVQWARQLGAARIIVVDLVKEKLDLAARLGADLCICPRDTEDVVAAIREATEGEGVHLAVESAGAAVTVRQCIEAARKQGTVVYLGTPHCDIQLSGQVFESILRKELQIVGSWCYHFSPPIDEWQVAIDFLHRGKIEFAPVVTHKVPLARVDKAFEMIRERKEYFNKVMISMEEM